ALRRRLPDPDGCGILEAAYQERSRDWPDDAAATGPDETSGRGAKSRAEATSAKIRLRSLHGLLLAQKGVFCCLRGQRPPKSGAPSPDPGDRMEDTAVPILVNPSPLPPMDEQPVEFVERKGKGHPDTLCDKAAEELSIALMQYYQREYGAMRHYNVDKALLVGGTAEVGFGHGRVTQPIELILCGRARARRQEALEHLVQETTRAWLAQDLPDLNLETDLVIRSRIRPGSDDLVGIVEGDERPLANDTSFGVGYAPLSELERIVLQAERTLN